MCVREYMCECMCVCVSEIGSHYVDEAGLELTENCLSASAVLGLKACTAVPIYRYTYRLCVTCFLSIHMAMLMFVFCFLSLTSFLPFNY